MKCINDNCKNEFESANTRKKFCSGKCKVAYHRKYGKRETVTKFELTALYNEFKSAIQNLGQIAEKPAKYVPIIPESEPKPKRIKINRSPEQWLELKRECETAEQWLELKQQIMDAENLSERQKLLIINTA